MGKGYARPATTVSAEVKISVRTGVSEEVRLSLQRRAAEWVAAKPHWLHSTWRDASREGRIQTAYYGLIGEWILAKYLWLEPDLSIHSGDGGVDLLYHGITVQAKASWHTSGNLIYGGNWNKGFEADITVLMLSTLYPDLFEIAGFITRQAFAAFSKVGDFGYGKRRYVPQELLTPMPDVLAPWREKLAAFRR